MTEVSRARNAPIEPRCRHEEPLGLLMPWRDTSSPLVRYCPTIDGSSDDSQLSGEPRHEVCC
jgi:hypothetical protein